MDYTEISGGAPNPFIKSFKEKYAVKETNKQPPPPPPPKWAPYEGPPKKKEKFQKDLDAIEERLNMRGDSLYRSQYYTGPGQARDGWVPPPPGYYPSSIGSYRNPNSIGLSPSRPPPGYFSQGWGLSQKEEGWKPPSQSPAGYPFGEGEGRDGAEDEEREPSGLGEYDEDEDMDDDDDEGDSQQESDDKTQEVDFNKAMASMAGDQYDFEEDEKKGEEYEEVGSKKDFNFIQQPNRPGTVPGDYRSQFREGTPYEFARMPNPYTREGYSDRGDPFNVDQYKGQFGNMFNQDNETLENLVTKDDQKEDDSLDAEMKSNVRKYAGQHLQDGPLESREDTQPGEFDQFALDLQKEIDSQGREGEEGQHGEHKAASVVKKKPVPQAVPYYFSTPTPEKEEGGKEEGKAEGDAKQGEMTEGADGVKRPERELKPEFIKDREELERLMNLQGDSIYRRPGEPVPEELQRKPDPNSNIYAGPEKRFMTGPELQAQMFLSKIAKAAMMASKQRRKGKHKGKTPVVFI